MSRRLRLLGLPILLLGLLAGPATAVAAPSSAERALQAAEELLAPAAGTSSAGAPNRDATLILRNLARLMPRLHGSERRRAERIFARPDEKNDPQDDYFGAEATASPLCTDHFCVHWSAAGKHAPQAADSQPNGFPDYVEAVLSAATQSYAVENTNLGWAEAKPDGARGARNGRGGAGQVDIYLADLGKSLFGYATTDRGHSSRSEPGYLVLDNDYSGFGRAPVELMQVTMAHEYNHVLQFNYDGFQDTWMFESTATWVEEMVYPAINDYLRFTTPFSKLPFVPMAEPESAGAKIYGSGLWNHWLSATLGPATIRTAWEVGPAVKPRDFAVAAYDRAIALAGGGSFSRQFAAFAALTAEINANTVLPDAGLYKDVRRSGKLTRKTKKLTLNHTAYRLYKVNPAGSAKLTARIKRKTRAAIALVGRSGTAAGGTTTIASEYLPKGGRATVRLPASAGAGGYDRVTAVLINADGRVRGSSRYYTRDSRKVKARLK